MWLIKDDSRTLLGATIAANPASTLISGKIFSLAIVTHGICLGGASKQNGYKKFAPKNTPMPLMSRIGPVNIELDFTELLFYNLILLIK